MPKKFAERTKESAITTPKKHIEYAVNKYTPKGFDVKQMILIAIARQESERNPNYAKYENCYANKQYTPEVIVCIFDLIEFGVNPNEYILSSMKNEEIVDIANTIVENIRLKEETQEKEGIWAKIKKMKEENISLKNEKQTKEATLER